MGRPAAAPRYRVVRGRARMWDVLEIGVETAIASFHGRTAAITYARRLAASRGAEVLIEPAARGPTIDAT